MSVMDSPSSVPDRGALPPHSRTKYFLQPYQATAADTIMEGHRWIGGSYGQKQPPALIGGFTDEFSKLAQIAAGANGATAEPSATNQKVVVHNPAAAQQPAIAASPGAKSHAGEHRFRIEPPAAKSWLSRPRAFNELAFDNTTKVLRERASWRLGR